MCERILLIEDDPDLRKILAAALTFSEYHVTPAADGLEGLILAHRQHFDLIIADKIMPIMDGNEFVRELAKMSGPPPVIMLTGDTSPNLAEPDSSIKVTFFKPISLYNLLDVVRSVLHSNLTTISAGTI